MHNRELISNNFREGKLEYHDYVKLFTAEYEKLKKTIQNIEAYSNFTEAIVSHISRLTSNGSQEDSPYLYELTTKLHNIGMQSRPLVCHLFLLSASGFFYHG